MCSRRLEGLACWGSLGWECVGSKAGLDDAAGRCVLPMTTTQKTRLPCAQLVMSSATSKRNQQAPLTSATCTPACPVTRTVQQDFGRYLQPARQGGAAAGLGPACRGSQGGCMTACMHGACASSHTWNTAASETTAPLTCMHLAHVHTLHAPHNPPHSLGGVMHPPPPPPPAWHARARHSVTPRNTQPRKTMRGDSRRIASSA